LALVQKIFTTHFRDFVRLPNQNMIYLRAEKEFRKNRAEKMSRSFVERGSEFQINQKKCNRNHLHGAQKKG